MGTIEVDLDLIRATLRSRNEIKHLFIPYDKQRYICVTGKKRPIIICSKDPAIE